MKEIKIDAVEGFSIGQATDTENGTGCTVILCRQGAVCGTDVRGGGPASRDSVLLDPRNTVQAVNAVVLSGGSAYGLEAGTGVMEYLAKDNVGLQVAGVCVPIVVQADLFDLAVANPVWPDTKMGYAAAAASETQGFVPGNHGAGTGACVGKMLGIDYAMKTGIGAYALENNGLQVGAIVAVNACGDVYMPDSRTVLAGVYDRAKKEYMPTEALMLQDDLMAQLVQGANTTIACILTNADLTKAQANRVATIAHDGYARTIHPVHMSADGDTIFCMASQKVPADLDAVAILATRCIMEAIVQAVKSAKGAYGMPAWQDLQEA